MTKITPSTASGLRPPHRAITFIGWMKINLFSSWHNTLLSALAVALIYYVVSHLWPWGIRDAVWVAENRRQCLNVSPDGACWAGVIAWFDGIIYGRYPTSQHWRINLSAAILALWLAPLWLPQIKHKILIGAGAVSFYPFIAAELFMGGTRGHFMQIMVSMACLCFVISSFQSVVSVARTHKFKVLEFLRDITSGIGARERRAFQIVALSIGLIVVYWSQLGVTLMPVSWEKWGGLFLTLVISGTGIATALPLGIILALGRTSSFPSVRVLSVAFIELFRSVPLIAVLFMATTIFPLLVPEELNLNKLVQVLAAVCLFNACYMAEIVRGGLQTVPNDQYEAAKAIGFGYWTMMGLIVLPQALRNMIPNIIGNLIGLLKDTTLVTIIGLFDILSMINASGQDVPWHGMFREPLLFGAAIFFVLCYSMSRYSQRLEVRLGVGINR